MSWFHQQTFAAGELSPRTWSRHGLRVTQEGLIRFRNGFLTETGTAKRRRGSVFVLRTRDGDPAEGTLPARLFPWNVPGATVLVEITDGVIRVYSAVDGSLLSEHTDAPWATDELTKIYGAQVNRALWMTDGIHEPRELWIGPLGAYNFRPVDTGETVPAVDLRATPVEISVEQTPAGAPYFPGGGLPTDQDLDFVTENDFFIGRDAQSFWNLDGRWYQSLEFISRRRLFGTRLGMGSAGNPDSGVNDGDASNKWTGPYTNRRTVDEPETTTPDTTATQPNDERIITFSAAHDLNALDVGGVLDLDLASPLESVAWILDVVNTTQLRVRMIKIPVGGSYASGTGWRQYRFEGRINDKTLMSIDGDFKTEGATIQITTSRNRFKPEDAGADGERGMLVEVADGAARVVTYQSPSRVDADVVSAMSKQEPTQIFGFSYGPGNYPTCCAEHQNRGWMGGFEEQPSTVISTTVGEYDNWQQGGFADQGLRITLSGDRFSRIQWMYSAGDFLVGSELTEYALKGQPITVESLGSDLQHANGGRAVPPVQVGAAVIFVVRSGVALREMVFRFDRDRYFASDLTQAAKHLFSVEDPVVQMGFVTEPAPMVLTIRESGVMSSMSYRREGDAGFAGWSPYDLKARSVAVIPDQTGTKDEDEAWVCVEREINGQTAFYIEKMTAFADMDSQVQGTVAGTQVTGLSHLEGELVQVKTVDGVWLGTFGVGSGFITGVPAADGTDVVVGLAFGLTMEFMPQDGGRDREGDYPGRKRTLTGVHLEVLDSVGGKVGDVPVGPELVVSEVPTAQSGWKDLRMQGLTGPDRDRVEYPPSPVLVADAPYPFEVASVALQVGPGGRGT